MTLRERYADQSYEIRLKAPLLRVLAIIFLAAAMLFSLLQFLTGGNVLTALLVAALGIAQIAVLVLLMGGRYTSASNAAVFSMLVLLLSDHWFSGPSSPGMVLSMAAVGLMLILAALVLLRSSWALYLTAGLTFVNLIVFIVAFSVNGSLIDPAGNYPADSVITAIVIMLIGASLALFMRRVFDRVLQDTLSQLDQIREKEHDLRTISAGVSRQLRETASLQAALHQTAAASAEIEENIRSIDGIIATLNRQFDFSRKALGTMGQGLEELDQEAAGQSANVTETSASIEEMVASINNVNSIIESRKAVVNSLGERASQGQETMQTTVQSFAQVLERIDSVNEMTAFISNVAGQTNLLAMNAAIEAAHAGTAGQGFAVVADEVRKLAESSSSNAKQIRSILKELMQAIKTAGSNVDRSGAAFTEIRTGVDEVHRSMDEIAQAVSELSLGSGEILSATGSMNRLTQSLVHKVAALAQDRSQVDQSVASFASILAQTADGMHEIATGTREIREAMISVQDLAGKLAEQAQALEQGSGQ